MNPWVAFTIGILIGTLAGILIAALCQAAAKRDETFERSKWRG